MRVGKSIPVILLLCLFLHLMPAGLPADSPVVRVAFSDAPPFTFHDSRGEHQGLYLDLIMTITVTGERRASPAS